MFVHFTHPTHVVPLNTGHMSAQHQEQSAAVVQVLVQVLPQPPDVLSPAYCRNLTVLPPPLGPPPHVPSHLYKLHMSPMSCQPMNQVQQHDTTGR
jgi:hypothetical protein